MSADYPESVVRAEVAARIHQGMNDEQCAAVDAMVRSELAAEPPIEPMAPFRVAIRDAKGELLSTDGRRDREAYRLATTQEGDRG